MFLASCCLHRAFNDFGNAVFGLCRGNGTPDGPAGHSVGVGSLFLFFFSFFLFQMHVLRVFVGVLFLILISL